MLIHLLVILMDLLGGFDFYPFLGLLMVVLGFGC